MKNKILIFLILTALVIIFTLMAVAFQPKKKIKYKEIDSNLIIEAMSQGSGFYFIPYANDSIPDAKPIKLNGQ